MTARASRKKWVQPKIEDEGPIVDVDKFFASNDLVAQCLALSDALPGDGMQINVAIVRKGEVVGYFVRKG